MITVWPSSRPLVISVFVLSLSPVSTTTRSVDPSSFWTSTKLSRPSRLDGGARDGEHILALVDYYRYRGVHAGGRVGDGGIDGSGGQCLSLG